MSKRSNPWCAPNVGYWNCPKADQDKYIRYFGAMTALFMFETAVLLLLLIYRIIKLREPFNSAWVTNTFFLMAPVAEMVRCLISTDPSLYGTNPSGVMILYGIMCASSLAASIHLIFCLVEFHFNRRANITAGIQKFYWPCVASISIVSVCLLVSSGLVAIDYNICFRITLCICAVGGIISIVALWYMEMRHSKITKEGGQLWAEKRANFAIWTSLLGLISPLTQITYAAGLKFFDTHPTAWFIINGIKDSFILLMIQGVWWNVWHQTQGRLSDERKSQRSSTSNSHKSREIR